MCVLGAIVILNVYGFKAFDLEVFVSNSVTSHLPFVVYLVVVNVVILVVFMVDMQHAIERRSRFREATLMGLSIIGGSIGGMIGMRDAHHKTRSYYFKYGLPLMLVVQVILVAYLLQAEIV